MSTLSLLSVSLAKEPDVVLARQRARQIAGLLGFAGQDATRISTAVSEIARNAVLYAGGGRVDFQLREERGGQALTVEVTDAGPGIPHLAEVLGGRYQSPTGMGMGIVGTRRLMEIFRIEAEPGRGTRVTLGKPLPRGAPPAGPELAARVARELAARAASDPIVEVQQQNQELLQTLDQLRSREQDLLQLNRELEDTNRGVVALYAELDERLEQLRRANALRGQFTSYLSHEFRTPLDSMIALSGLLLERMDGELTEEQDRQVGYIRRSARDLLGLVDDMLDTARVESGQVSLRPEPFRVEDLFNSLRATLRPLIPDEGVSLVFEEPADVPTLHTDPAKLSQILRNLVGNALKFTERGEVRVAAALDGELAVFTVTDSGIGIAPEDQERIFEDFARVEHGGPRIKGTGLGLPLSRKLARMLGGEVSVESEAGRGSRFRLRVPRELRAEQEQQQEPA